MRDEGPFHLALKRWRHRLGLVLGFGLLFALADLSASPTVGAQSAPCRFVLGFAEMRTYVGPGVVGDCVENQRTLTGPEELVVPGGWTLAGTAGLTVQRTTTGLLLWFPASNSTQFWDADGIRKSGPGGVTMTTWSELQGASSPPAPRSSQAALRARCEELAIDLTADVPRSLGERLAATWGPDDVTAAAEGQCREAAATDGARGVDCFEAAFAVARGRERLFPGQGFAAYRSAYDRCIAGR